MSSNSFGEHDIVTNGLEMKQEKVRAYSEALGQKADISRAFETFRKANVSAASERDQQQWDAKCLRQIQLINRWNEEKISLVALGRYRPRCLSLPYTIYKAVYDKSIDDIGARNLVSCANEHYLKSMRLLLEAEEAHQAIELRKLDTFKKCLKIKEDKKGQLAWVGLTVENLSYRSPAIVVYDYVVLENDAKTYAAAFQINTICGNDIGFRKETDKSCLHQLKMPLNISYISAGAPFRYCQKAIETVVDDSSLQELIFDDVGQPLEAVKINVAETSTPLLKRRLKALNESQRKAVMGILTAKCRPKPYILFGPPGTGKTHTLIEAVFQVYERTKAKHEELNSPFSKMILVAVNSNTCADDLTKKLRKVMPNAGVQRINAGDAVHNVSNIVVTTNTKSGSLASIKFDYIFLDEAGHANAPESLVPLCKLNKGGTLVLAGDPKQLGPVVKCKQAEKMGLHQSLLERLFNFKIYQLNPTTKEYNSDYITMLQDCYRCDERILAPCNKLFYADKLECVNETPRGLLALLRFSGPIQLKGVYGEEAQCNGSTSWHNLAEAEACREVYLSLLKMGIGRKSIGISSPYKAQVNKIKAVLASSKAAFAPHLQHRFNEYDFEKVTWTPEEELQLKQPMLRALHHSAKFSSVFYEKVNGQYVVFDLDSYANRKVALYKKTRALKLLPKVDSIDAFQGNEREVMIISTVRTERDLNRLDFINDARRFNVAVSRAKWLLIIIGNPNVLQLGDYWPVLIQDAKTDISRWPKWTNDTSAFSQLPLFRPVEADHSLGVSGAHLVRCY